MLALFTPACLPALLGCVPGIPHPLPTVVSRRQQDCPGSGVGEAPSGREVCQTLRVCEEPDKLRRQINFLSVARGQVEAPQTIL